MRALAITISALILILINTQVSAEEGRSPKSVKSCRLVTPMGTTTTGYGNSLKEALEDARLRCGDQLIDAYFARNGDISDDQIGDATTACVNLNCTK